MALFEELVYWLPLSLADQLEIVDARSGGLVYQP
jgi:hypothetical protein